MTATFDNLPPEIIKRIALSLPCDTIFSLLRVSRRCHHACNDHLLFKQVIINNAEEWDFETPWNLKFLSHNTSVREWAFLAWADTKSWQYRDYQQLFIENDLIRKRYYTIWDFDDSVLDCVLLGESSPSLKITRSPNVLGRSTVGSNALPEVVKWAPQLAIAQHPFIDEDLLIALVAQFKITTPITTQELNTMFFVLAWAFLTLGLRNLAPSKDQSSVDTDFKTLRGLHRCLEQMWAERFEMVESAEANYAIAAMIMYPLTRSCRKGEPYYQKYDLPYSRPMFTSLGLHPTSLVPGENGSSFPRHHIQEDKMREFLEDGEWIGYQGIVNGFRHPSRSNTPLVPQITGIHLKTSSTTCDDTGRTCFFFEASGEDGLGMFELSGEMSPAVGDDISITKTDGLYGETDWKLKMTPFGMIGRWGRNGEEMGHVWLWKRAWCDSELA